MQRELPTEQEVAPTAKFEGKVPVSNLSIGSNVDFGSRPLDGGFSMGFDSYTPRPARQRPYVKADTPVDGQTAEAVEVGRR